MPSLIWSHVCEYANMDNLGRLNIIGMSNNLTAQSYPAILQHFTIISEWSGSPGESFSLDIHLVNSHGDVVRKTDNTLRLTFKKPIASPIKNAMYFVNVEIDEPGEYGINFIMNGEETVSLPVYFAHEAND